MLTSGLDTWWRLGFGSRSTLSSVAWVIDRCITHILEASKDTSTTEAPPDMARCAIAAAIAPASIAALVQSPNAADGWTIGYGESSGVICEAIPPRAQKVMLSYPPLSASEPFCPSPLPTP